jgi:phosphatidylglycerol---prolipoprotein diacylglyceryl transferase
MFPILFRIPLPHRPLMLWWALAAAAVISIIFGALSHRKGDAGGAKFSFAVAAGAAVAGYFYRTKSWEATALPIYSFGVMLALSLIAGWYLTLYLADKAALPKETMANCYVLTAIVALICSRLAFAALNPDKFSGVEDLLAIRKGGYSAFGGFLGGALTSWAYLRSQEQKLLPWADVLSPALALGLAITRVGSYLFGSDYGTHFTGNAPGFLQKLGTFPRWSEAIIQIAGEGPPVYLRHRDMFRSGPLSAKILETKASLPVHPTQLYEVVFGLVCLAALFWLARAAKFKGQLFFTLMFVFSVFRFLIDFVRNDDERGEFGAALPAYMQATIGLLIFGAACAYALVLWVKDPKVRLYARIAAFVPAVAVFLGFRPSAFGQVNSVTLSTTQWLCMVTGVAAAVLFSSEWMKAAREEAAKRKKKKKKKVVDEDDDDEAEPAEAAAPAVEPDQAS